MSKLTKDQREQLAEELLTEPKTADSGFITCMNPENMHDRTTDDLISRQAAMDVIDKYDFDFPQYMERFVTELRDAMKADLKDNIKDLPSAEPKKGKWIPIKRGERGYSAGDFRCDNCGKPNSCYSLTEYCSACGAAMQL